MVGVGNHLIGVWGLSTLIFLQLNPHPFQAFLGAQRRRSTLVGQTEVASFGYNQYPLQSLRPCFFRVLPEHTDVFLTEANVE